EVDPQRSGTEGERSPCAAPRPRGRPSRPRGDRAALDRSHGGRRRVRKGGARMNPSAPDARLLLQAVALGLVDPRDPETGLRQCAAVVADARAGRLTEREFVEHALAAMEPMRPALCRAISLLEAATKTPSDRGDT